MSNSILTEPVYRSTYRFAQNLCKGRINAARINRISACNSGKENPAKAQLLMSAARKDAMHDYVLFNCDTVFSAVKLCFSVLKNLFKVDASSEVRKADKEFTQKYKELYPTTYKLRNKLIRQGRVTADNDSYVLTRRSSFRNKAI